MHKTRTDYERFCDSYEIAGDCWEWKLSTDKDGYGQFSVGSSVDGTAKRYKPHRFSYEAFVGAIPDGYVIDHLCKNRRCVNPAHLEAVTVRVNVQRSSNSTKTHCKNGHPLSGDNLYIRPDDGSRCCRKCRAHDARMLKKRRRAASAGATSLSAAV